MFRQIKYFQTVVKKDSFSEAAEECHISQSAISQQIKGLEMELGFKLLERKNRKFSLTLAGEHFYKKSLILLADYEKICIESAKIASGNEAVLKIGYLKSYRGNEFYGALDDFSVKYPRVSIKFVAGNHEELFNLLRCGNLDIVLNDQRRAFSDEYVNLILTSSNEYIEISKRNPISQLKSVTLEDLKNIPCILVASKEQREIEEKYYRMVIGFNGEFIYAENLEEARLFVICGQGFMPVECSIKNINQLSSISRIPLFRRNIQINRNYCLFWKKDNSGYYIEEFADILKSKFK